jgi:Zinc knuckle
MKRVMCYACGEWGHIAKECPKFNKKKKEVNAFTHDDEEGEMRGWFPTSFD